jgi:hypothetical protein
MDVTQCCQFRHTPVVQQVMLQQSLVLLQSLARWAFEVGIVTIWSVPLQRFSFAKRYRGALRQQTVAANCS